MGNISGVYMGVDPSLSATGLVVIKGTAVVMRATLKSEKKGGERLFDIADQICAVIQLHDPHESAFEAPFVAHDPKFVNASLKIAELHGAIKCEFARRGLIPPYYVAPATLKKFVTGSGRGEKSDVKMYILKKWGLELKDNNQADAYGLARIAGVINGGLKGGALEYELEAAKVVKESEANAERLQRASV